MDHKNLFYKNVFNFLFNIFEWVVEKIHNCQINVVVKNSV